MSAEADLSAAWRDAVDQLRRELARMPSVECADAQLAIEREGTEVRVAVVRADGRRAARPVPDPGSLVTIALGLVVSIPEEEDEALRPALDPQPAKPADAASPPPPPTKSAAAPPRDFAASRAEMSLTTGARFGGPTSVVMAETELRADLRWPAWFIFAGGRYVPVSGRITGATIPDFVYDEVALSLGGGRSVHAGTTVIDFGLAPTLVFASEQSSATENRERAAVTELRVDASVRAVFHVTSPLRPVLVLNGELAPFQIGSALRVDSQLPAIPSWTVGLRAGIAAKMF